MDRQAKLFHIKLIRLYIYLCIVKVEGIIIVIMGSYRIQIQSAMVEIGAQEMGRSHTKASKHTVMFRLTGANAMIIVLGHVQTFPL